MTLGRPKGAASPPRYPPHPPEDLVGGYDVNHQTGPGYCGTCGRPDTKAELLTFRLWSVKHGKWAGYYRLCGKCWERSNERPDPDPRHVEEAAA